MVITIIILLILAGVSIAMLTGDNGILTKARQAQNETENAQAEEEDMLANYESYINSYSGENTEFTDSLGNQVKVPAGFKVVNPTDTVCDGIVIEDVTHTSTAGSQFVWIPVGEVKKKDGTTANIKLSRYTFDETTGQEIDQGESPIEDKYAVNYQELATSEYGNTTAKDIEDFKIKANVSSGYYIGRYEARTAIQRTNKSNVLTQVTFKAEDYVYNYVTQQQAADLSRNMYSDSNFESDLINSYAWDTAIVYLQAFDNREDKTTPYSRQNSLNTTFAPQGTNRLDEQDVICNIYDMASNTLEWTTETSDYSVAPCVNRGGTYYGDIYYTSFLNASSIDRSSDVSAFRVILYL